MEKKSKLVRSFGGYVSVDPREAVKENWPVIQRLAQFHREKYAKKSTDKKN